MCSDRRAITAALVLACLAGLASPARAGPPRAGEEAPAFTLPDLAGRPTSLEAFRGRPVLLHFWATWCPTCRDEMPLLDEAAREAPGRIAVLGINLGEKKDVVAAYVAETGLAFPMLLDARGKVAARYRVIALPATLVVDAHGRIAEVIHMGALSREALQAILTRLESGGTSK